MSIIGPAAFSLGVGYTLPASRADGTDESATIGSTSAAEQEFLDYARKTPAERIREAILKDLGLTEEDLENMAPEQRAEIEKLLEERIKDEVEKSSEPKTGMIIDVTA